MMVVAGPGNDRLTARRDIRLENLHLDSHHGVLSLSYHTAHAHILALQFVEVCFYVPLKGDVPDIQLDDIGPPHYSAITGSRKVVLRIQPYVSRTRCQVLLTTYDNWSLIN